MDNKRRISASVKDSRLWRFPAPLREAPFILFVGLYANPRDSSAQANRAFTPAIHALTLAGGLTQVLAGGDTTYLYGVNRIAQVSPTQTGYFLPDVLGSVRQIADGNALVDIVLAQSYTPYGEVLESYGTETSEYAFTEEMYDSQTGLVYLKGKVLYPYQWTVCK